MSRGAGRRSLPPTLNETGHQKPQPIMSESAYDRIRVRGHLGPVDARRLRGLDVENTADERGAPVAVLRGTLPDQAAVMGVLHALHDYQLPLLSAEFLPSEEVA